MNLKLPPTIKKSERVNSKNGHNPTFGLTPRPSLILRLQRRTDSAPNLQAHKMLTIPRQKCSSRQELCVSNQFVTKKTKRKLVIKSKLKPEPVLSLQHTQQNLGDLVARY